MLNRIKHSAEKITMLWTAGEAGAGLFPALERGAILYWEAGAGLILAMEKGAVLNWVS